MTERTLLDKLEPIDPTTLVERIPGIDAACPRDLGETSCQYPWCTCYRADREPQPEKEAA